MKKLIFISIVFLFSCTKKYTCNDVKIVNGWTSQDVTYEIEADPKEVREWVEQGNYEDYSNGNEVIKTRVCN